MDNVVARKMGGEAFASKSVTGRDAGFSQEMDANLSEAFLPAFLPQMQPIESVNSQ